MTSLAAQCALPTDTKAKLVFTVHNLNPGWLQTPACLSQTVIQYRTWTYAPWYASAGGHAPVEGSAVVRAHSSEQSYFGGVHNDKNLPGCNVCVSQALCCSSHCVHSAGVPCTRFWWAACWLS